MFGIRALRLAEKAVHQLHTPMAFTEAQTWGPLELLGAGVACEMGIFNVLSRHWGPLAPPILLESSMPAQPWLLESCNWLNASYFGLPAWLHASNYRVLSDANHCAWQVGANTTATSWENMSKDPSLSKYFSDYMAVPRTTQEEDSVSFYPFETVFTNSDADDIIFVGIGGRLGHQAMRARSAFPRSRSHIILQDLPQVTGKMTGASLPDVEIMDHDVAHPQPFLSQFAAATGPESRLLIHETLAPELNPTKNITRFDLSMFASFGGAQSSKAEHKALLEKVGLEVSGTRSTPREWSIMEARLKRE
ncbi:hypothetical protein BDV23DRAFT_182260 [Aspergillus alliaceus]|uniref:O-methyltransferase domain-containing protein n=1 Tax=Petromyces alliaceus TaxID=209559 RepID=A0A5N7CDM9_PETAA|nr:hypothetical protein BDV23DRAFT_182260 [Aspergillus alliaceus]